MRSRKECIRPVSALLSMLAITQMRSHVWGTSCLRLLIQHQHTHAHTARARKHTLSFTETQTHTDKHRQARSWQHTHTPKLVAHVLAAAIGDSTAQTRLVAELARLVKNLLHQLSRRRQNEATRPRRAPVALRNRSRPGQRVAAGARSTKRLQNAALIDALETNARHPMQRKQRPTYPVTCQTCTAPGRGARGT